MLDPSERELSARLFLELSRRPDPSIRDRLVELHLDIARRLARRFLHRGEAYDDLVQVASVALIHAVDRFDPERGFEFSTFATQTILGELKRHFRDRGWSIRVPRRIQELYLELGAISESLHQGLGRSPTVAELAAAAGRGEDDVIEALEAGRGYRSLSIDASIDNEDPLSEQLADDHDSYAQSEIRTLLRDAVARLGPRERAIVAMRFDQGLTQAEIAERVGISQMHVSRLLTSSLRRLRSVEISD